MKNPFDYFDKIYCICGEHETDRWKHCCEQFEKLGIMDRVERFSDFASHAELESCKMDGCTHSHYSVLKLVRKENLKNVFIFESDFHFINYDFDLMQKSFESLDDLDWKLFYMGGIVQNVLGVVSEHLVKSSVATTHAYAVNGKYFEKIIKKFETMRPPTIVDQMYRRIKKYKIGNSAYISYPMFALQKDGYAESKHRSLACKMYKRRVEPEMKKYLIENDGG